MKGKKKGKIVEMNELPQLKKFTSKNYFIFNTYCNKYLDTNFSGDLFMSSIDRKDIIQKWELILEDEGNMLIKNAASGFYLSTDEQGKIHLNLESSSPFQRWNFYPTSEKEIFIIKNVGSSYALDITLFNEVICTMDFKYDTENGCKSNNLFKVYPLNVDKR